MNERITYVRFDDKIVECFHVETTQNGCDLALQVPNKREQILISNRANIAQLEYLAVYGRASMGDYYGCAFPVLAVFRQLLTRGQV